MNIGTTIKNLRRQKEMTQEQLAEYLDVTVSAISQWESGRTMPDISLLPPIANLFGVSADTLLGIDVLQVNTRVEKYKDELAALYKEHRYTEMLTAARNMNKEIPNNPSIMDQLAFALSSGENASLMENIDEAIQIYKLILEKSVDNILRFRASSALCRLYAEKKHDKEQALFYARQLPKGHIQTSSYLINRFDLLEDGEKEQGLKFQIENYTDALTDAIYSLADPNYKNKKCSFSVLERIEILQKELELLRVIYGNDLLSVNREFYEVTRIIGCLWLLEGDSEKALDAFEAASEHAVLFDMYTDGEKYSSLLMSGIETDEHNLWSDTATEDMLSRISSQERYDGLRSHPRFIRIIEKLEKR